jgi:hypothetical protein
LSASLTRLLRKRVSAVAIAARDTAKLAPLCAETGARAFACDAEDEAQVSAVRRRRPRAGRAGCGHLQRQRTHTRTLSSSSFRPRFNADCR